jgi:hypothetical protein
MVSIRAGLREARASGAIGGRTHDRLVAAAKGLYYPDRSWPRLFQLAGALEIPAAELAALRERISRARPDVKRADAIQLLRRLAADGAPDVATPPPPGSLPFDFEPTWYWEQLILHEGSVGEADDSTSTASAAVSAAALRRHVRLHATRARDPLGAALLLYLADEQAARRGILDAAPTPAPAPIWAGGAPDPLLSAADRASLARGRAAVAALLREAGDQVNRRLAAALAHIGRLEPTVAEVRRKQAALRSLGLRSASPADAGVTLEELLSWYQRRFGPIDAESPEAHAAEAGFTSFEEFVGELVVEYLVERGAGIGPGR